ncbi:LysR family transcriptional regulator, partial [Citrobacter freundii]
HMGMACLPESMVAEELVNQKIIHSWPENADLICQIPVVVWAKLDDQRADMQRCREKFQPF